MTAAALIALTAGLAAAVAYYLSDYADRPLRDNVRDLISRLRHPKDGAQ